MKCARILRLSQLVLSANVTRIFGKATAGFSPSKSVNSSTKIFNKEWEQVEQNYLAKISVKALKR